MYSELVVHNDGAAGALRVPLTVECNTPDEKVLENVLANSRKVPQDRWIRLEPAHDRVAIICGGGPSLANTLDEIRGIEGDVFALNGAASFLFGKGILPAFQIIMDAQPQTASLIGPAKQHLFASQVDPACFDRVPNASLWHTTYGELRVDEQDGFPAQERDYCMVGASISVGNTALVLLYIMGYRTIHVFGMDSSHKDGKAHAYRQPMNDGDPCTVVNFMGKEYVASVSMELQARHFRTRAEQLKAAGCEIIVHGDGLLPAIANAVIDEAEKYQEMWSHPEYRDVSPGEECADKFLALIQRGSSVIDFGCGTGRGALKIDAAGHPVTMVDFADNCLDGAAKELTFVKADLCKPLYLSAQYGFCADVMEHIPTDHVETVIRNIMDCVDAAFFQISTIPDSMGALIGQRLHLTVKSHSWWRETFERLGYAVTWDEEQKICSSFMVKQEMTA